MGQAAGLLSTPVLVCIFTCFHTSVLQLLGQFELITESKVLRSFS